MDQPFVEDFHALVQKPIRRNNEKIDRINILYRVTFMCLTSGTPCTIEWTWHAKVFVAIMIGTEM